MAMKVSREGLIEIAAHEGIVTSPYRDSVGVWTVGIGHTASAGNPNPAIDRREFSIAEIMDIFARDIAKFEKRVNQAFKVKLKQHEFDAAVSMDFNTGGIHRASWVRHVNSGNRSAAKKAFMNWRKPPEIIPRRRKERDLFFSGKYTANGMANSYPASAAGRVLWGRGKRVNVGQLMDIADPPFGPPRDGERGITEKLAKGLDKDLNGSPSNTPQNTRRPDPAPTTPETPSRPSQTASGSVWAWLAGLLANIFGRKDRA